ncbi:MAG: nucleoside-diphosphate sugar epimerase/dehydratase [Pseudomonadota bacterium]
MSSATRLLDRLRTRAGAFVHDLLMIPIAWLGAYWLRYNLESIPEHIFTAGLQALPVVIVVQGFSFWYFGLYRGVWRFASLPDLLRICKGVLVGVALVGAVVFLMTRMEGVPRSVFPLYMILLLLLLGAPRLLYRRLKERNFFTGVRQNVGIVGAGRAGEALVRDLRLDAQSPYEPVAFFDDDPEKFGRDIHGVPVVGSAEAMIDRARALGIELLLLAVPSATSVEMRRLVGLCERTGIAFRTLPRLSDLASGQAALRELREVSIEDLLGREPVALDWMSIRTEHRHRVVMVTGGAGSIGSELCRQIAALDPARVVIVDQSEHNLYLIGQEFKATPHASVVDLRLADVVDRSAMRALMREYRPDLVFHAAAYKHVPTLEHQVREAVKTNVLGTHTVAEAAVQIGCQSFVLISTDKAVHPANVMGATKRLAELVCQRFGHDGYATQFVTVRFGNVLDSVGSVVPLFRSQIEAGGPVTVTDKRMTRYFMTIPEACQLILQAAAIGRGGDVMVLNMGEPVSILYLAEQMIRLAGQQPGRDIEIVTTSPRPGEKLHEELFHADEPLRETAHEKLFLASNVGLEVGSFDIGLSALESACETYDDLALRDWLARLVPKWRATMEAEVVSLDARRGAESHER